MELTSERTNQSTTPYATPSTSTETLMNDNNIPTRHSREFITEEIIKELGWKIHTSYDQELRSKLHIEYLNKYIDEDIIPKGLKIRLAPSIQDDNLVDEWNNVLDQASKNIMKVLIKHYEKRLLELNAKRNEVNADMDKYWTEPEKTDFVDEINDGLQKKEESLRRMKDGKLERDRSLNTSQTTNKRENLSTPIRTTNRLQYAAIAKRHIKEQLQNLKKAEYSSGNRSYRDKQRQHVRSDHMQRRGFFEDNRRTYGEDSRSKDRQERPRGQSTSQELSKQSSRSKHHRGQYHNSNFRNNHWKENNHTRPYNL